MLGGASHLALRNLLQDKLRLALSVAGIALAVMLILFLLGLREGGFRGAVAYLDNAPGSVVVLPQGVRSTAAGSARLLPLETVEAVAATPGVARSTPVLLAVAAPDWHGRKEAVRLIGYEDGSGGGPWSLSQGREPAIDNEVVLDRALADRHGFRVGDEFDFGGRGLVVSGLSNETSSWVGSYMFAPKALVEALVLAPGSASFVVVTPDGETNRSELIAQLQEVPGVSVLLKSEVMANNRQVLANIMDKVIFLMVAAAFIVGALVVGMVVYTATLERRGEYGVLKAVGARNSVIYRIVLWQAMIAAGLGVVAGVLLAFGVGGLVTTVRPQFPVVLELGDVAVTLGAGFIMALLGAVIPARSVAGLPPAEVFRR